MISELASPSVCVIDNEPEDFEPILKALNGLFISAVHIIGSMDSVPPQPFKRLRLVFVDLHLTAAIGKDAASHTANIFIRTVSADTAPVIVVIWSKFAGDKVSDDNVPPEDQDTEAEVFKKTLLGAEPKFTDRLIFVEMPKPKPSDRPGDWTGTLKNEISNALRGHEAVEALWSWESLVADGCSAVTADLTSVAQAAIAGTERTLKDGLKATAQKLAKAQGEGDLTAQTAPGHLLAALSGLLTDQLEQPDGVARIGTHGQWLHQDPVHPLGPDFFNQMNSVLMTAGPTGTATPFVPGTVFRVTDAAQFAAAYGVLPGSFVDGCCQNIALRGDGWRNSVQPVLIEVSPVCDAANPGKRVTALLIAGLIVPTAIKGHAKKEEANLHLVGDFRMRWPVPGFAEQNVFLMVCQRYRITIPAVATPGWLTPWFRLRELPTASIRNLGAAYSARVGYVSLS